MFPSTSSVASKRLLASQGFLDPSFKWKWLTGVKLAQGFIVLPRKCLEETDAKRSNEISAMVEGVLLS